jgi:hypothetical protein
MRACRAVYDQIKMSGCVNKIGHAVEDAPAQDHITLLEYILKHEECMICDSHASAWLSICLFMLTYHYRTWLTIAARDLPLPHVTYHYRM